MATQTASRKPRPLTLKQQAFVRALPLSKSAKEAAIKAGYSNSSPHVPESMASENMRKPEILAALETQIAAAAREVGVTPAYVLGGLKNNHERSIQAVPVLDRKGEPTGEYQYEGAVANRSLELLGKHLGMFEDKKDAAVVNNDNRTQILMAFSPEQLRALLAAMSQSDEKDRKSVV